MNFFYFSDLDCLLQYCPQCKTAVMMQSDVKISTCIMCSQPLMYQCRRCSRVYQLLNSLRYHLKHKCNKEPRFFCDQCEYKTQLKASFLKHLACMHTDVVELHRCPKCPRTYKHRSNMLFHEKNCNG